MQAQTKPRKYTYKDGTIRYKLNGGGHHREDGPAIIWPSGTQEWWLNGKHHRADGPAIIGANGTQMWCINGKWHRLDGPAVIQADGTQEWWLNNTKYSFDDYCKQLKLSEEDIVFLKLKFNTCIAA